MQNINERSNKDEIISHSLELVDQQQDTIDTLRDRQTILVGMLGILMSWILIFAN